MVELFNCTNKFINIIKIILVQRASKRSVGGNNEKFDKVLARKLLLLPYCMPVVDISKSDD